MKNVHLVIADLFLPEDFAAEVCAGLHLPALERILARGATNGRVGKLPAAPTQIVSGGQIAHPTQIAPLSLEAVLYGLFDVPCGAGVAPISAAFDGLGEGCWLRADPVHVRLQREQVVLLPDVDVNADEALHLCASLNEHFAGQGMVFFAPHPQRWYLKLAALPDIATVPLSQAAGHNIHGNLPTGAEARRWHQLFNEVQMLLFAHPLNAAREARGAVPVNSVWFWGNGSNDIAPQCTYDSVSSDEVLVEMLASAAGIPFADWSPTWHNSLSSAPCSGGATRGGQLLVWSGLRNALQRGDLAAWRQALQDFENGYAQPLWQALRSGKIARLQVDISGGDSLRQLHLTRGDAWAIWRRAKCLPEYSVV